MSSKKTVTLAGCGKMGGALLQSWLNSYPLFSFGVIDPHPLPGYLAGKVAYGAQASDIAAHVGASDVIVLAVKPQIMGEVCAALKPHVKPGALVLSIAAGQSIALLASYFHDGQPIVRTMPNTPAAIGKGISVAVANAQVSEAQVELAHMLLESAGLVEWAGDEALLDAVTAVSGSGPAYVFYLIEALAKAGVAAGLPEEMAMTLARQTVIGSAALAEAERATSAETLRKNVTSPGGTTAAALEVLMNGEFQDTLTRAVLAAKKRGGELNS